MCDYINVFICAGWFTYRMPHEFMETSGCVKQTSPVYNVSLRTGCKESFSLIVPDSVGPRQSKLTWRVLRTLCGTWPQVSN